MNIDIKKEQRPENYKEYECGSIIEKTFPSNKYLESWWCPKFI